MKTLEQMLRWAGSKAAEGWLGRRQAKADFDEMATLCKDIAEALGTHRDVDAHGMMVRLQAKLEKAQKAPCFTTPPKARKAKVALVAVA